MVVTYFETRFLPGNTPKIFIKPGDTHKQGKTIDATNYQVVTDFLNVLNWQSAYGEDL